MLYFCFPLVFHTFTTIYINPASRFTQLPFIRISEIHWSFWMIVTLIMTLVQGQLDAKSFVMENKVYWLVIASFRTIQNVSVRDPNKNYIFHFGLFDTYGLVKKWSEYSNFVQPGSFFLRGKLYFYQIDNKGLMELYQFDLKNLTQKTYIQSISSDFSQSFEKPLIVQTLVWILFQWNDGTLNPDPF